MRRWGVRVLAAMALVALVVAVAGWRLFVDPSLDRPVHVDAIVMLGGTGPRFDAARRLAEAGYADVVLESRRDTCPQPPRPGVQIVCFVPRPFSTRGEARFVGAYLRAHGLRSVLVVAGREQAPRARVRLHRCLPGPVRVVAVTEHAGRAHRVLYEAAALAKAEIWQRGC